MSNRKMQQPLRQTWNFDEARSMSQLDEKSMQDNPRMQATSKLTNQNKNITISELLDYHNQSFKQ